MKVGLFLGQASGADAVARLVRRAQDAEADGFDRVWLPNGLALDAMTVATAIGLATSRIGVGTAVVPTYPRHPIVMAQQALSTQQATRGRFTLGIGVSHRTLIEDVFGYSYAAPARHMREYLDALVPLLRGEQADVDGATVHVHGSVTVDALGCPLLLAAMGPRMLELAGSVADGTITWMTGPRTLEGHVIPALRAAAASRARDADVVVALPVCVTDDLDRVRGQADSAFAMYGRFPAYRAMLDKEGVASPGDVAIIGDEHAVSDALSRLDDLGVAEIMVTPFWGGTDAQRTRTFLRGLAHKGDDAGVP